MKLVLFITIVIGVVVLFVLFKNCRESLKITKPNKISKASLNRPDKISRAVIIETRDHPALQLELRILEIL